MGVQLHLIEDNTGDAKLIFAYLSDVSTCPHSITWTRRLSDGIESLAKSEADLILLDLGLPDSLGLSTFRTLHARFAHIPTIVLSGLNDQEIALSAVREGAQDYLVKGSFDEEYLCKTIRYALERKKNECALQRAEERYRSIFENAPVGILRAAPDGRLLTGNEELGKILGYKSAQELLKNTESIADLLRLNPFDFQRMIAQLQENREVVSLEARLYRGTGTHVWISGSFRCVRDESGTICFIDGFVVDITDRRKLEALREDVDRVIRHDLKSPLTAIINLPQILLEADNFSEEQRRFLRLIEDNGQRMLRMITTSLKMFKLEGGNYEIGRVPLNMLKLVGNVKDELRSRTIATQSPIRLTLDGNPVSTSDAFVVEGEKTLCFSLLENLIANAQEATHGEEEVIVEFDSKALTLSIRNKGEVPPEIRGRLFEKYATFGKTGGTGLGLYSAKMISQAHGWDLRYDASEQDQTLFILHFSPKKG